MSQADKPSESAAPEGARPAAAAAESLPVRPQQRHEPTRAAPRPRGGGSLALALLLSLAAVGVSGYVGWQQWQQDKARQAGSQDLAQLQQRTAALEASLATLDGQRASLSQRLGDASQVNRSMRETLLGQAERLRNAEDALAKLAQKSLSGRDGMLLDDTESLLRMGAERYRLFHDAPAAAAAYALADQTLAAVNDGAFGSVRESIQAERQDLLDSQPAGYTTALGQLGTLRERINSLPLKPLDRAEGKAGNGGWARIGRALAGVISVQRDDGTPLAVADARLARELAGLDLAQAQAALLDHDGEAYAAALRRVDGSLSSQFDGDAPAVQQAHATLQKLAGQLPADAPVELGAALAELRNLRSVRALGAVPDPAEPASASTVAPVDGARP